MSNSDQKINPCLFCGSKVNEGVILYSYMKHNKSEDTHDMKSYVYCRKCKAQGPKTDSVMCQREEAVELWNRAAPLKKKETNPKLDLMSNPEQKIYVLMHKKTGNFLSSEDHCRFAMGSEFKLVQSIREARTYNNDHICLTTIKQANQRNQNHGMVIAEVCMSVKIL